MRVLICGGRDFPNGDPEAWRWFSNTLEKIALERFPRSEPDEYGNFLYDVHIISGAAKGIDTAAIDWAVVNWAGLTEYPADWKKYGKRAGYIRNAQMLEEGKPDLVIAFPGGKGTAMMVRLAKEAGVEVIEVH